ncbi:hydrogenase large subunit [Thermodesulfobacterium commune]|uniref:NADH-quinone oxidoreductase subunit D domain-containing protein n=1 Tax=Thermodesulfobacterium commune DSM 2178 TaxID=289377 RepID=A0A075WU74_9BACT|nr:nickel-dependent hydrogenase large subunit [Thermodesulfobacterium commune]AIH04515.1 hypothetical protein HL41_07350 [Thermodesulfobacterium commune DSM 2178]
MNRSQKFVLPIGPIHIALEEPIQLKLETEGNIVKNVQLKIGYVHRAIEFLLANKDFYQGIIVVERVCGICSHSHPTCFVQALEQIAGIEVPLRARYLRTLIGELERIHSHLLNTAIACEILGFKTLFVRCMNARENIKDLMEGITGHRGNYAFNTIGGVRKDLLEDEIHEVKKSIDSLEPEIFQLIETVLSNSTLISRTKEIGVLTYQDAIDLSVVGPVARASGVDLDLRKDVAMPGAAYEFLEFEKVIEKDGDVLSRVKVRLLEMIESFKIIKQILKDLPKGPILTKKFVPIPKGIGISRWEAPRGGLIYYCITDGTDIPYRVKIRAPSFVNIYALNRILINQDVADVTIISGSIDPCFSCMQR